MTNKNDLATMITKLRHQTKSYLYEVKKLVDELKEPDKLDVYQLFYLFTEYLPQPSRGKLMPRVLSCT